MTMKSFGRTIRDHREDHHWTQDDLARRLDISRPYLSQIERGVAKNLTLRLVWQLMEVLKLSSSDIFADRRGWRALPPGLNEFATRADLSTGELEMLAQIEYRGKQPDTPEKWRLLYAIIKAISTED